MFKLCSGRVKMNAKAKIFFDIFRFLIFFAGSLIFSLSFSVTRPLHCSKKEKQECIPVGCVPPAHYRMGGSP